MAFNYRGCRFLIQSDRVIANPGISPIARCPLWYIAIPRNSERRQTHFAFMVQFLVFLIGEVWSMFTRVFRELIEFNAVG